MAFRLKFMKIILYFYLYKCLICSWDAVQGSEINDVSTENDEEKTFTQFRNFMREAKRVDGVIDPNILIQRNINDPVPISDFNISSSGIFTDIRGHFTDVSLHGLKSFEVQRVEINLAKMNLSAEMFVPSLSVVGQYVLDGKFTFMQVSGEGGFWMNLTDVFIRGHSPFYPTEEGNLEMGEVILYSDIDDINLHFENLMGGGTWSRISNSVLNQLSELILDELKHSLLKELGSFLRSQFNDHLFRSLPRGFLDLESPNVVDSVLKRTAELMIEKKLDPLPMPELKKKFEQKMLFFTTRGELRLTNGYLYGLSSLNRRGDVKIVFANHSILLEANFGFDNLTANYDWEATVFDVGPQGSLEIQVKSVDGFMRLQQELRNGSLLDLGTFLVKDIRQVWLDIQGLGTWDYIMEIIVNLATNGLKMQLADAITGPVRDNIQKEIDSLNLSVP